jgi:hypothetical protein
MRGVITRCAPPYRALGDAEQYGYFHTARAAASAYQNFAGATE